MTLAFVGTLANALVIIVNQGYMPIWEPALTLAGLDAADVGSSIHMIFPPILDASFLLHLGPLGDVIPIPFPFIQNVASVGDLFLAAGLAFFLFASIVGIIPEPEEAAASGAGRRPRVTVGNTGLSPALAGVAALERPLLLGGRGMRMSSPTVVSLPVPRPEVVEILRRHPYVKLALNGSFSALWAGQFISMFGDRIHQFALAAVVLTTTGSEVLAAFAFVAAALPNLFLSPIAGTFVDRWDRKEVLVVSDILRAAVVLLIPVAAVVNVFLVYPLIFVVTSISIFFRPARVAILPQLGRARRARHGQLRDVGRRDDRRRHRVPTGRAVRGLAHGGAATGLLAGRRHLPGLGGPAGDDRRPPQDRETKRRTPTSRSTS